MKPQTPLPAEPAESATEIQMLTQFLDYYRAVLRPKAEGLTTEQLRQRAAVSTMTLGGLLHHLDYVEDEWFGTRLAGEPAASPWDQAPWSEDMDWDWHRAAELTPEQILRGYDDRVARSRQIQRAWTEPGAVIGSPGESGMTYRYVLIHLVEEYARHAGHADLLREAIDGSVGD